MTHFQFILFTLMYVFVVNKFVSTLDCNSISNCNCFNVTNNSKLVCSLGDQDSFDFRTIDVSSLSHIEVHGKRIVMQPVSPSMSYTSIKSLHLEGHKTKSEILHSFLIQFPNIHTLHIRNCNVTEIETGAFRGLYKLETLDLSGNQNLAYNFVETGLSGLNSPQLRRLNLSLIHNPDGFDNLPLGRISFNMFKSLANTSLEVLDVSFSRIYLFEASASYTPHLRSFNCSGTGLLGTCMTTLLALENLTEVVFDFWPSVKRSAGVHVYPKPRYKLDVSETCEDVPFASSNGCYVFPSSLRTIHAQHFRLSSFYIDLSKGVCMILKGLINLILPEVALSSSFVSIVGLENLQLIDISYPEYVSTELYFSAISSKFFHSMPSLKIILIPGNRLDAMSEIELEQLFSTNKYLELIDISNNGLQQIPRNMFGNNLNLQHLNLSRNELTSFVPDSTTVKKLKVLDLSYNKISHLDGTFLARIMDFHNLTVFNLDISHNLLPCDCTINSILSSNISDLEITCYDITNVINIIYRNETAQYPCHIVSEEHHNGFELLPIIIPIIVVILLVVCIIVLWRRKMLTKKPPRHEPVVHFVRAVDHVTKQRNPEFLSFVAYSHIDSNFVCLELVPKLDRSLRKLFPDYKGDILCLYDKHFIPGQGIDEACEQAVLNCYVIVAIITKAFLNSSWCDFEIKRAFINRVPVIPLYLVNCDPEDYKGIFRDMFEDRTRMEWPSLDKSTISKAKDPQTQSNEVGCVGNLAEKKVAVIDNLAVAIYSHVQIQMH